jgi:hypothetical protein
MLGQNQSVDMQQDLFFCGDRGGEPYALVTSCSDVVAFLKSSETDSAIGLVLIGIRVEMEYRSVDISLSGWGPKGESNALMAAGSEDANLLKQLKLI